MPDGWALGRAVMCRTGPHSDSDKAAVVVAHDPERNLVDLRVRVRGVWDAGTFQVGVDWGEIDQFGARLLERQPGAGPHENCCWVCG